MANPIVVPAADRIPAAAPVAPCGSPGPLLRVQTRLRAPWLDMAIARGRDRPGDPALALRRAQLTGRRQRTRLAARLEEVIAGRSRPTAASSAAPIDGEAVDAARPILTELVLSLRSSEAITARGVLLGRRLLTDPASPLYQTPGIGSAGRGRLARAALAALIALRSPPATPP